MFLFLGWLLLFLFFWQFWVYKVCGSALLKYIGIEVHPVFEIRLFCEFRHFEFFSIFNLVWVIFEWSIKAFWNNLAIVSNANQLSF